MCVMCLFVDCMRQLNTFVCVGCTVNKIGDVGAQSIGDSLKSLTLLTTLILNGECCVMYTTFVLMECVCV